jgi:hypothetical protein
MIARRITKRDTQAMIKALRKAGLTVDKSGMGAYTCEHPKAGLLFKALPGRHDYLVRMREDLFG